MKKRVTVYLGEIKDNGLKAMDEAHEKAYELKKIYTKDKIFYGTIDNFSERKFQAYVEIEKELMSREQIKDSVQEVSEFMRQFKKVNKDLEAKITAVKNLGKARLSMNS